MHNSGCVHILVFNTLVEMVLMLLLHHQELTLCVGSILFGPKIKYFLTIKIICRVLVEALLMVDGFWVWGHSFLKDVAPGRLTMGWSHTCEYMGITNCTQCIFYICGT